MGERDTLRDPALRQSARLDKEQGENRFERGQRWINAMCHAAHQHGLNTDYRFVELPSVGHSFRRVVKEGGLAEQVFNCLFDTQRQRYALEPSVKKGLALNSFNNTLITKNPCEVSA